MVINIIDDFNVTKRNQIKESVKFDKITNRLKKLCYDLPIDVIVVAQKTIANICNNITTQELDQYSANICAEFGIGDYNYNLLGGRILASNLKKNMTYNNINCFTDYINKLPNIDQNYLEFVNNNKDYINNLIVDERDYNIDFFGFKTLEQSYFTKFNNQIIETPQYLWMRLATFIHYKDNDLEAIKETYDLVSQKYFIHATPTLFNSGQKTCQLCSCFLLGTEDSLTTDNQGNFGGIYKTLSDCATISKWAGGIGVHVSNIRAKNSLIKSTQGKTLSIVPMLKLYNDTALYVNQGGRRNGSIAIYLEPWHDDIQEFLELKLNTGSEELRTRDLFLALWIPDLFMKQVEKNGEWYTMSPDDCPGLTDVYGEEFENLYWKYVNEGKYRHKYEANKIWQKILTSQIETGVPYICFKDSVNKKSNQKNIGIVKSSNLCSEIMEVSSEKYYAVCNLASIAVNNYVNDNNEYDWNKLHHVAKVVTKNLNKIIDLNFYPTPETEINNKDNRPIGIGIQGFGDLLYKLKIPYESNEALEINKKVMETIYHGAVEASIELAEKHGPYKNFDGSPMSKGIFQFDMWDITPSMDWSALKEKVQKVGIRNSLLTALMPTASTSQILGNIESFEPMTSNIYSRKTLAGTFIIINKYLIEDLKKINLWNNDIKNEIISNRGSIQNISNIPNDLKNIYKTIWEIKQRSVIDHSVARGPYVDQSQSMNLYMAQPNFDKLTSALFYGWKNGLKTGCYYLRSLPASQPLQFSQDINIKSNNNLEQEKLACSLNNREACMMCSS
jgi:ribonucleoside-diphosphate reductase alpha subunit